MPWNSKEFRGIPYKNQLPRYPQGSLECLGITWNIVEDDVKSPSITARRGLGTLWKSTQKSNQIAGFLEALIRHRLPNKTEKHTFHTWPGVFHVRGVPIYYLLKHKNAINY